MKVLVAIPALDLCHTDFTMSLAALLTQRAYDKKMSREVGLALSCAKGTIIPHSRNLLVADAQRHGATHIFFLDSDMCFPPDTLSRLISAHVPIVGADYVRRVEPYNLNGSPRSDIGDFKGKTLAPMLTLPFGCILISMKVFEAMSPPYFTYVEGATEQDTLSEDVGWCNTARAYGHTIWCDRRLTLELGHVGTRVFRPSDRRVV